MKDSPIAYFNSNNGTSRLAFGKGNQLRLAAGSSLRDIQSFIDRNTGKFILVNLSYDFKNELEQLDSSNIDELEFPLGFLWVPKYVVHIQQEHVDFVQGERNSESMSFIDDFMEEEIDQNFHSLSYSFEARTSKKTYLQQVDLLKKHIERGDIYEVNYCQEFFAKGVTIDYPLDAYFKLNNITRAPFSCFVSMDEFSIFCGSPERFISKNGKRLSSEPIKGTTKRGSTPQEDQQLIEALQNDPKERSENVMIVDLVRNDLSKIARKNSVKVDELCKIYSFETVHQMISKISCELDDDVSFTDIIQATFPMGSMTGAPKVRAMELIEQYEHFQRGIYSGSIGFIQPNGDFDLNVVIRTLVYNKHKKYLSCSVGSAITISSDPEREYQECLVKVKAILDGMS